jgi:hypothetical protein
MAHVTHVTPDISKPITQLEALGVRFQVIARSAEDKELRVVAGTHKLNAKCRAELEIQEPAIVEFLTERIRQGITPPIICEDCGEAGHLACGIPF